MTLGICLAIAAVVIGVTEWLILIGKDKKR